MKEEKIALTRKQFAVRLGVSPSYVTKLGNEGRLVMTPEGRVDVEASERLIAQTGGTRPDVSARHADSRRAGAKKTDEEGLDKGEVEKTPPRPAVNAVVGETKRIGNRRQAALAIKEKYAALRTKAEYKAMMGGLIPREDVEAAMRFIGGAVRAALEILPDQTAPLVAPITDLAEIHDTLQIACRDALHAIADAMSRQKEEVLGGSAQ